MGVRSLWLFPFTLWRTLLLKGTVALWLAGRWWPWLVRRVWCVQRGLNVHDSILWDVLATDESTPMCLFWAPWDTDCACLVWRPGSLWGRTAGFSWGSLRGGGLEGVVVRSGNVCYGLSLLIRLFYNPLSFAFQFQFLHKLYSTPYEEMVTYIMSRVCSILLTVLYSVLPDFWHFIGSVFIISVFGFNDLTFYVWFWSFFLIWVSFQ